MPLPGPRLRPQHLPRAGERRGKACESLGQGRGKGNPDRAGGTLPEGGAGPGTPQTRGHGRLKHSETITTIPASSQPRRKADPELGPSLDLFYSTSVRNTIFIPISQMAKLRLREVEQLGQAASESELRTHACFPSPVPETGGSPGKVAGSWGPADLPRKPSPAWEELPSRAPSTGQHQTRSQPLALGGVRWDEASGPTDHRFPTRRRQCSL